MHKLAIIIVATACYFYVEGRSEDEPKCYSRFDYEYKVVEKLFECETAHKKQMEMIAELKDALDIVKSSSDDMRRELDITKEDSSSALDMINGGLKRGNTILVFLCVTGRLSKIYWLSWLELQRKVILSYYCVCY